MFIRIKNINVSDNNHPSPLILNINAIGSIKPTSDLVNTSTILDHIGGVICIVENDTIEKLESFLKHREMFTDCGWAEYVKNEIDKNFEDLENNKKVG